MSIFHPDGTSTETIGIPLYLTEFIIVLKGSLIPLISLLKENPNIASMIKSYSDDKLEDRLSTNLISNADAYLTRSVKCFFGVCFG